MMKHVYISVCILFFLSAIGVVGECVCDTSSIKNRRLNENKKSIVFEQATYGGQSYKRPIGGSLLFENGEYLDKYASSSGCSSEQVHLTLGNDYASVIISFASFSNETVDSSVTYYASNGGSPITVQGTANSYSQLLFVKSNLFDPYMGAPESNAAKILARQDTSRWAYVQSSGVHWSNWYNVTSIELGEFEGNNPYGTYNSPLLITVTLTGLTAGVAYTYSVAGSCDEFEFTIPVQTFPFSIGITGDLGQTQVSSVSVSALQAIDPEVVFLVGDLAYADGWGFLWDSFGALIEPLAANVPLLHTGGNHEIDNSENWLGYLARYPTPHQASGSTNACYWAREVGVLNVVTICSYAGFTNSSLQYRWLTKYLSTSIDRTRTPWLVVMMHVPLYNSNNAHWMEGELMRRALEPLLYEYGVDIVIAGHCHSYERTYPVFNGTLDECGPTYLNVGDGGNYEGWEKAWFNNSQQQAEALGEGYAWSAFREDSFGVGQMQFVNASYAAFNWHRHACGSASPTAYYMNFSDDCVSPGDNSAQRMLTSDFVAVVRPSASVCPNRHVSTASATTSSSSSDSNLLLPGGIIAVIVVFAVFLVFGTGFVLSLSSNSNSAKNGQEINRSLAKSDHSNSNIQINNI